ncbi:hypothetical protein NE237_031694 [Protea cynaroides]|uniref:RING-type domain-containing protein n=1 Tax=Protea cynaroides TaxID=273540 RepID=A0A9Q0L1N2_9MAGN|nr:hypothetical protein NE237_031694 [Protea cynaroides]
MAFTLSPLPSEAPFTVSHGSSYGTDNLINSVVIYLVILLLLLGVLRILIVNIYHLFRRVCGERETPPPLIQQQNSVIFNRDTFRPIKVLPVFPPPVYFKADEEATINKKDCSICLEYFQDGELCQILPLCEHVFHVECIAPWLKKQTCPTCRTTLILEQV